ncbi:CDP-glycerol glycerophosphotransferase family protein [Neobacillus sp. PS3-34]|uniref:CDP-glycerol glycerophosphotransferase family protein n=1 Tax=Neobacillus sp. PS3-34 TaxID=3070678 RepID=UPI0027E08505|nr:CDP-glycerol glycerophosphotransferase family protein [Neobacillus sp. PS3-34]WML47808.1 CDP-glycerol glycerophosphotransferase family protein [Neobacillus sp. PS3-34]
MGRIMIKGKASPAHKEKFFLWINAVIKAIKKHISLIFIFSFNCLPLKNNKIFMFSYYGSQYGCNPKYITEHLLMNCPKNKYDIVWAFNDPDSKNERTNIRKVKTMSLRYFYELCTSKVIITNFRTTELFKKRKDQFYIQTWHSSLRLKQIEKDAEKALPKDYLKMAREDSKKIDLIISGCKYSTRIFKKSFWYNGEILKKGTPRNDFLFEQNEKVRKKICNRLSIPNGCKVVLYAPTFRNEGNLDVYKLDYSQILEKLKRKFGGEWLCLVKLHPHLISKSIGLQENHQIKDVTKYDDIQELLSITDVLISDYSSLIFDFSITKRPCFLYVPDYLDYIKIDRQLYFDLTELPFISATSNLHLLEKLDHFDSQKYTKNLLEFLKKVGSYENGEACKYLIKRIDEVCFSK